MPGSSSSNNDAPQRTAEIALILRTDFEICSVSMFGSNIAALTQPSNVLQQQQQRSKSSSQGSMHLSGGHKNNGSGNNAMCPEIRILNSITGEVICSDALPIKGFQQCRSSDYRMTSFLFKKVCAWCLSLCAAQSISLSSNLALTHSCCHLLFPVAPTFAGTDSYGRRTLAFHLHPGTDRHCRSNISPPR